MLKRPIISAFALLLTLGFATSLRGQMEPTTRRGPDEGAGPYDRLIIRGAMMIDGTGAAPRGPVDIVVEGERIASIGRVLYAHVPHTDPEALRRQFLTYGGEL